MLYGITFDVCLDPSFPCLLFTRVPRQPSVDESEDTRDAKDVSGDATDEVLDCFVYLKLLSFDSFFLFILLNLCCMYKIIQSRTVTILLATQNSHWGIKMILQMPMMRYVMCFMYSTLLPFVLCFVRFLKLMLHEHFVIFSTILFILKTFNIHEYKGFNQQFRRILHCISDARG